MGSPPLPIIQPPPINPTLPSPSLPTRPTLTAISNSTNQMSHSICARLTLSNNFPTFASTAMDPSAQNAPSMEYTANMRCRPHARLSGPSRTVSRSARITQLRRWTTLGEYWIRIEAKSKIKAMMSRKRRMPLGNALTKWEWFWLRNRNSSKKQSIRAAKPTVA